MTREDYRRKYGERRIRVVEASLTKDRLREGFTPANQAEGLIDEVDARLFDMLRADAECDSAFRQPIPYVLVRHTPTGRVFMTERVGGDPRLVGRKSIGLGGHIEMGEGIREALERELIEEVGLRPNEYDLVFRGYIINDKDEVGRVHLGLVYTAETEREDLNCPEKETLIGYWAEPTEIDQSIEQLEGWSGLVYKNLLQGEV